MKIAVWHDPYSPIVSGSVGGEDNLVELEIELLRSIGHEVVPVMRSYKGVRRKAIHAMITATGFGPSNVREILSQGVDLIHTNNMSIASGYSWMGDTDIPIVSSFHNYRPLCPISTAWRDGNLCFDCTDKSPYSAMKHRCGSSVGVLGSIRKSVFLRELVEIKRPRKVIFTSTKMANAYLQRVQDVNYEVLHNPSRLNPSCQEVDNYEEQASGFLFAGRLTDEKGILQLLQHWPKNESLTIAGKGELEARVKEICDRETNLNFIGTFSPNDHEYYKRFEALIFPSSWLEGSPLVVTEAISSGIPVIATNTSSAEELIQMSGCGLVINQSFSSEILKKSIEEVRRNRMTYKARGIAAASNLFSPQVWIRKLENIFLETLMDYGR